MGNSLQGDSFRPHLHRFKVACWLAEQFRYGYDNTLDEEAINFMSQWDGSAMRDECRHQRDGDENRSDRRAA